MTISGIFQRQAHKTPDKIAVIVCGQSWTYASILNLVAQQAHILRLNGLKRRDHVMTQLTGIDLIIMMLAAADVGICIVPVSPGMPQEILAGVYGKTDCKFLINSSFEPFNTENYGVRLPGTGMPDDLFLLITTSGSTGSPKPIMLTQNTKLIRVEALIDSYAIADDDRILISTPMHHSMGQRIALAALLTGATIVLLERWSPELWLDAMIEHKITFAVPVATQLKQISANVEYERHSMNSMRLVLSTSSFLHEDVILHLERTLNCDVFNCYGTTEIAVATSMENDCSLQSVGKPSSTIHVRIGEDGEIQVFTPLLFDGYYKQLELTQSSMDGGYFKTGDIGELDSQGNLFYLGRIKELVVVGGAKVFPQDVEGVVSTIPGIAECAAFSVPDNALGEIVGVAVVMAAGVEPTSLKQIQRFCAPRLMDEQLPRALFILDTLPRTESGKIQRNKLGGK